MTDEIKGGNATWRDLDRQPARSPKVRGIEAERIRRANNAAHAAGAAAALDNMNRPPVLASTTRLALDQHALPASHRTRQPTAKMTEAWTAVERLGSQSAAARELGITQGGIQSRLMGYMNAMGIAGPMPGAHLPKAPAADVAQLTAGPSADVGENPLADSGETLSDESADEPPVDVEAQAQRFVDQMNGLTPSQLVPALPGPPPGFLERLTIRAADVELTGPAVVPALAGAMTEATYEVHGLHTARRVVELLAEHGLELVLRQTAP